ncbi:MAG TPA: NAD(P)/FAD-dependent oxidoreductase [Kiritimatiellia bacterium]|nr:NAD(P)/FAD-dependent oxidoreductase [Kiritimatiellia bacterium]HRU69709.1 NAD(P)/FAD-dependent oxidoreductase [Kiritimatiellia bacterium]
MQNESDVLVIGAGVVGCAIAREVSRYALRVCVLEQAGDVAEGSTKANSAIVHAGFDAVPGSAKARFNVLGNARFEDWCRELDVPFIRNGSLVAAFDDRDLAALKALRERGERNGVPGLRILAQDEVRALEPNISRTVIAALLAPTGGICCPYGLTFRLAEHAAANGVAFFFERRVVDVARAADGLWQVTTADGGMFRTRAVVNAAGLYADELNNQVSAQKLSITPRRGEYLMLDKQYAGTFRATIFQVPTPLGKGVLVSPTVDGTLIVGPSAENIDDKSDTRTTAEGLQKVIESASRVWEQIPVSGVITTFSGLRAHGDRDDFVVGEVPDAPFFFNAAAMESPGLTAAPAVAVWLAEQIGERLSAEQATHGAVPAYWKAFREMTDEQRVAAIADNPAYGRIVCRCENVTEAEVRAAIRCRVGARTLDGVKRRTRSGMGRCQGGFCTPRIIEIMCDELGWRPEQITKFGGGSNLLVTTPGARPAALGLSPDRRESSVECREVCHD